MFKTTMTGSFYRTKEIVELLGKSRTGEVSEKNSKEIEAAEKLAVSDQLHPRIIVRQSSFIDPDCVKMRRI